MSSEAWGLFPFPTLAQGQLVAGSMLDPHPQCRACKDQPCQANAVLRPGEVGLCRYGISYARVDNDRLIVGVVASDSPNPTPKARRRRRTERERHTTVAEVARLVDRARSLGPGAVDSFELNREAMISRLRDDPDMLKAIAAQFRRDAESDLNQSHDFLQMVKLIKGYAESLLKERFPDLGPEDAAERLPKEGAIYFATLLMTMKVDSLLFIQEVNRANGDETTFRIHPFLLKYVRIYDWQARQKNLKIALTGKSVASVHYNSAAIGALIQSLLDNLVKYAPARSEATISFIETDSHVEISMTSLGPRIEDSERDGIFLLNVRGKAARKAETAGQGVGLAAAKQISDALDLHLSVNPGDEEDARFPGRYATTFTFRLRCSQS